MSFETFYLQRATAEFAEDLDKARSAEDFKTESVAFLVHALSSGTSLFSEAEQARIMGVESTPASAAGLAYGGERKAKEMVDVEDIEVVEAQGSSDRKKKSKKEKKDKKEKKGHE